MVINTTINLNGGTLNNPGETLTQESGDSLTARAPDGQPGQPPGTVSREIASTPINGRGDTLSSTDGTLEIRAGRYNHAIF